MSALTGSGLLAATKIAVGVSVQRGQQRGPLRADLLQDPGHLLGVQLPRWQRLRRKRIGGTRAAPIKQDQAANDASVRQNKASPGPPTRYRGDRSCREPSPARAALAENLIGDAVATQPRKSHRWLHRSSSTNAPTPHKLASIFRVHDCIGPA
jgi:hypothetical protein